MNEERYVHLNKWLKSKFSQRVLKICVDGGFTCPNRDGRCGTGGCIFCGAFGSGKSKGSLSIKDQIEKHLKSYRGQRADKFIVYFQNFTNTYGSINTLKEKYDEALSASEKIVGLSVATRPDCVDENVAKLLSEFKKKIFVQVELGLQTANNKTGKLINRGYETSVFENALKILNAFEIDVVVHIMVGLPNEGFEDLKETVNFLNSQKYSGIKIHSTYVTQNTKLCDMLQRGEYKPLELEEYLKSVVYVLTHIKKDVVIHRISGDAPKEELVAPLWNSHKKLVLNGVDRIMREENLIQGQFYEKKE